MQLRNLNLQSTGDAQGASKASGQTPPLGDPLSGWLNPAGPAGEATNLAYVMLMLQKLFGMLMGGIAMGAQFGSAFVCLAILLLGYSVVFRLLSA